MSGCGAARKVSERPIPRQFRERVRVAHKASSDQTSVSRKPSFNYIWRLATKQVHWERRKTTSVESCPER